MSSRREFLQVSAAAGLGMASGLVSFAQDNDANAKQLLVLWQEGGQCQRLLNPKHGAPGVDDIFDSIETSARGIRVSEMIPLIAERIHNITMFRARHTAHFEDHLPGIREQLLTTEGPNRSSSQRSTYLHALAAQGETLVQQPVFGEPPNVNTGDNYRGMGFVVQNMCEMTWNAAGSVFVPPALTTQVDRQELERREGLLRSINTHRVGGVGQEALDRSDHFRQRALRLLRANRSTFTVPPERVRKYCPPNHINPQGVGVATMVSLFEAGLITVGVLRDGYDNRYGAWDQHNDYRTRVESMAPRMDHAHAALLQDFENGELPPGLNIVTNMEFGRTPRLNRNGGRDHYPWFTSWIASRQLRGGFAHGRTDNADRGDEGIVNAEDYAAIIRELMSPRPNQAFRRRYPFFA